MAFVTALNFCLIIFLTSLCLDIMAFVTALNFLVCVLISWHLSLPLFFYHILVYHIALNKEEKKVLLKHK